MNRCRGFPVFRLPLLSQVRDPYFTSERNCTNDDMPNRNYWPRLSLLSLGVIITAEAGRSVCPTNRSRSCCVAVRVCEGVVGTPCALRLSLEASWWRWWPGGCCACAYRVMTRVSRKFAAALLARRMAVANTVLKTAKSDCKVLITF